MCFKFNLKFDMQTNRFKTDIAVINVIDKYFQTIILIIYTINFNTLCVSRKIFRFNVFNNVYRGVYYNNCNIIPIYICCEMQLD